MKALANKITAQDIFLLSATAAIVVISINAIIKL